jgi:hypothetical protein
LIQLDHAADVTDGTQQCSRLDATDRNSQITFRQPADETQETGDHITLRQTADETQQTEEQKLHFDSLLMRH